MRIDNFDEQRKLEEMAVNIEAGVAYHILRNLRESDIIEITRALDFFVCESVDRKESWKEFEMAFRYRGGNTKLTAVVSRALAANHLDSENDMVYTVRLAGEPPFEKMETKVFRKKDDYELYLKELREVVLNYIQGKTIPKKEKP